MIESLVDRGPRGYYTKPSREMQLLDVRSTLATALVLSHRAATRSRLHFLSVIGLAHSVRVLVLVVDKAVKGAENA